MNLWSLPLIAGLSLALPLVPAEVQAPTQISEAESYALVGDGGFTYRWSDDATGNDHTCELYAWCTFADILGPTCPGEVFIALEFYDQHGDLVTKIALEHVQRVRRVFYRVMQ